MTFSEVMRRTLADYPENAPSYTRRERLRGWWRACRPPFFVTAAIPVAIAMAFVARTGGAVTAAMWGKFAVLLVGCFMGLTIANFANDLFDHVLEVDDQEDSIGGTGVIQAGLISCRQLFIAVVLLSLGTFAVGAGLVWSLPDALKTPLLGLTAFAVASAVFYVAPPIRYGCRGLGEVMVGINMGFIMVGASSAILAGSFDLRSLAVALPVVGMVSGILYYQSMPETETDKAAGKTTLANILGKQAALFALRLWWPAVWIACINLWLCGLVGWPVFFCLLGVPLWWKCQKKVAEAGDGDWLPLDANGWMIRVCYLLCGVALVAGIASR